MPLSIITGDITKLECTAIVNAANNSLLGGGGVDGAIHRAAGKELLEECRKLGGCNTGDAKITGAYKLPCKYVIHTVGPIWRGGNNDEEALLRSCFQKSLAIAKERNCESIAFPLISAGAYGYPKNEAFAIALEESKKFLLDNEMTIYIVIYDKSGLDDILPDKQKINRYIERNYEGFDRPVFEERRRRAIKFAETRTKDDDDIVYGSAPHFLRAPSFERTKKESLKDLIDSIDDTFAVTLLKLIDKKGMSDVECYKRANVSRQTWYKIMNDKDYKPSKNTIIAFAIALKLDYDEAIALLATEGFTLSRSKKFDIIIEYYIRNKIYDIYEINEMLFTFDQPCLGV